MELSPSRAKVLTTDPVPSESNIGRCRTWRDEDFIMDAFTVPQATHATLPEKVRDMWRTVRERKTIQRNVFERASTSAQGDVSSPTPRCVTNEPVVDRGAAVDARSRFSTNCRACGGRKATMSCDTSRVVLGLGKRRREESGQDSARA